MPRVMENQCKRGAERRGEVLGGGWVKEGRRENKMRWMVPLRVKNVKNVSVQVEGKDIPTRDGQMHSGLFVTCT